MRKIPKLKIFSKCKTFILECPKKMLKFKHSKWKFFINTVQKKLKKSFFLNFSLTSPKLKQWDKRNTFYKQNLSIRREFMQVFDSSVKMNFIKNNMNLNKVSKFDQLKFLHNSIIKLEFRLDILLFRLNFFPSIYESRNSIEKKEVFLNNKIVSSNVFLSKGDIINIKKKTLNEDVLNIQIKSATYVPFVEIDYYTSTIIITKNLCELSFGDISLFLTKHINLSKMHNAIYKN